MRVSVDKDVCIGTGSCSVLCPEVFGWDDDGLVVLLVDQPAAELSATVHAAADACPVSVITVED